MDKSGEKSLLDSPEWFWVIHAAGKHGRIVVLKSPRAEQAEFQQKDRLHKILNIPIGCFAVLTTISYFSNDHPQMLVWGIPMICIYSYRKTQYVFY